MSTIFPRLSKNIDKTQIRIGQKYLVKKYELVLDRSVAWDMVFVAWYVLRMQSFVDLLQRNMVIKTQPQVDP